MNLIYQCCEIVSKDHYSDDRMFSYRMFLKRRVLKVLLIILAARVHPPLS